MPSLGDVANQILNVLNQIQTNTAASAHSEADIDTKLDTLQSTVKSGFIMTGQGLFAILEQQKTTNSLLLEEVEQNKTIICWLTNIANVLCEILRKTEIEVELQMAIRGALEDLDRIAELVHAREAIQLRQLDSVEDKVEKCCPKKLVEPKPCFEPCTTRDVPIHDPKGGDFQPPQGKGFTQG
jgi:hypothetical protein